MSGAGSTMPRGRAGTHCLRPSSKPGHPEVRHLLRWCSARCPLWRGSRARASDDDHGQMVFRISSADGHQHAYERRDITPDPSTPEGVAAGQGTSSRSWPPCWTLRSWPVGGFAHRSPLGLEMISGTKFDLGFYWWQVLGSNQRRLSRRFYRPPAFPAGRWH